MAAKRVGKPGGGPWYSVFKARQQFEHRAIEQYPSLTVSNKRKRGKLWREYRVMIRLDEYEVTRSVTLKLFSSPHAMPEVKVDGPDDSPHRYETGQLCMWYPWTVSAERWTFSDGLLHLLVMIEAHLFREAWWRETREWLGPERAHEQISCDNAS